MKAHELVATIGPEAAQRLAEVYGGGKEHLPSLDSVLLAAERNAAVWRELKAGMTYKAVALRHGITVRWVRQIEQNMRDVEKIVN